MGCSESQTFKSSITFKTNSTIDSPSPSSQLIIPISLNATYDNFDTYELEDQNISYYYDEIQKRVIPIPKLRPIHMSIIFQRRKMSILQ